MNTTEYIQAVPIFKCVDAYLICYTQYSGISILHIGKMLIDMYSKFRD